MSSHVVAEIAVDQPVDRTFSYIIPESLIAGAAVGMRVLVPFGRRKVTGYILETDVDTDYERLKPLEAMLDKEPVFNEKMLLFFRWIASYYLAPLGEVIKASLPPGINSASCRFVSLGEKVEFSISNFKGRERDILSLISEKGELKISQLESRLGKRGVASVVYRLAASGVLNVELRVEDGRVSEKLALFVSITSGIEEKLEGLSSRQKEVLVCIEGRGDLLLKDLLAEAGTSRETIKRMADAGLLVISEKAVYRDPFMSPVEALPAPVLTEHQRDVMGQIEAAVSKGSYAPFLLEGRTGSGKTEIYLRSIELAGGSAIVLIPEIALTPQLTARFRERFGDRVAVLHSGLSPGERFDQWRRIREGSFDIVVGARSAIFAPLKDVNVIVVDEEHEPSYKQEDGIRYNARDLALVRGKMENSLVLLGSATPSLESLHNVNEGKLGRLLLPERVGKRPLPSIDVVDMRRESKKEWLSRSLKNLISETLERGEQVLLFLNRRGFAPHVFCGDCGHTFKCPHCSVSLTWHQRQKRLRCHYCDYQIAALPMCPECQGDNVMGFGLGTEKLEAELGELFEGASIARIDRDTVKTKGSMERLLASFGSGEIDILIGTQMIAKGHHFPGVTLVGVLMADLSLNVPDFRAAERTFQLLTQVAGRAGRGDQPGRVVVQTFLPDHYAVLHGGEDDAALFYKEEFEMRKAFSYPPFCRLLNIKLESSDEESVATCAKRLRLEGEKFLKEQGLICIELLGPVPSPMSRIKRKYRWHMVAKCTDASPLHRFARAVISYMKEEKLSSRVRLVTDFDPYSLL